MGSRPARQRYCRCGTRLAADNLGRECARCQRASRDKFLAPPRVPADFWETEQFHDAFGAQHIGQVARAYRLHPHHQSIYGPAGISQGLLGRWFGLSQPQISRIENGPSIPNLDTLAYWARMLRIPPQLLWFDVAEGSHRTDFAAGTTPVASDAAALALSGHKGLEQGAEVATPLEVGGLQPWYMTAETRAAREDEDVERRRLLESLAVLGAAATLRGPGQALETVRQAFNEAVLVDDYDHTADDWQEVANEYAHAYLVTPPQRLLPDLAADIVALRSFVNKDKSSRRRGDLCSASATLAAVMAMTTNSLGLSRESRHWWRSARHAADASGNRDLLVWVHGYESMNGLYQDKPFRLVLDQAEATIYLAGHRASPGMMEAMGCKAQILAQHGAADDARRVLESMRDTFAALPSELVAERSSLLTWPQHRLLHTESFVYTVTGHSKDAEKSQEAALAAYPMSMPRERAQVELHQATGLVGAGHIDDGIAHAEHVLQSLPVEHHTRLIRIVAGKVLSAVPDSEMSKPSVSAYREQLAPSTL